MALLDQVQDACRRLAPAGWGDLLRHHGLDIEADDLEAELKKSLGDIDRRQPGFEDFALEGERGIEPGHPSRSLLFHALASPNVLNAADGSDLALFPTVAELEAVENYVYATRFPTLDDLRQEAGWTLGVVVFASEYRPATHTCHRRHADMVFSRTGIARIGTAPAHYDDRLRGYVPREEGEPRSIRVLPSRYAAYVAARKKGSRADFCPMNHHAAGQVIDPQSGQQDPTGDANRDFWVPLHKLFDGPECLDGLAEELEVTLAAHHVNEKIRRYHLFKGRPVPGSDRLSTGPRRADLDQPPFRFTENIAALSPDPEDGTGLLVPHSQPLVAPAHFRGEPLTFNVPANDTFGDTSSLDGAREGADLRGPEYLHARHMIGEDGNLINLNEETDPNRTVAEIVGGGGYKALHYVDFTGDGWVNADSPQLSDLGQFLPAFSLVTAPDFFLLCDQRELIEWTANLPGAVKREVWATFPSVLSDQRIAANLQLPDSPFDPEDGTITSIVSRFGEVSTRQTEGRPADALRHSPLPDDSAGVFAPGWDVSRDTTSDGATHLATYGLGSPFPEDAKLCAALSTFWPAAAPDATRAMTPRLTSRTVCPLTDEEIGQRGILPWDGVRGPQERVVNGVAVAEYADFDYVDYVQSALDGLFTMELTARISAEEYQNRVLSMALVYRAVGRTTRDWLVLSFRHVTPGDPEFQGAQTDARVTLTGRQVFQFTLIRNGPAGPLSPMRTRSIPIRERTELYADPSTRRVLMKRETDVRWREANVGPL